LNRFDDTNIQRFYGVRETSSFEFYHVKAVKKNIKCLLVADFTGFLTCRPTGDLPKNQGEKRVGILYYPVRFAGYF